MKEMLYAAAVLSALSFLVLVIYMIANCARTKKLKKQVALLQDEVKALKEKPAEVVIREVIKEVAPAKDQASQVEDNEDDRESARRIPFAEKMLNIDNKTQEYYEEIYNAFIACRRINPRVSSKGVSFRLGRELVAKLTIRGKTMKMHLALDVKDFEEKIFFQKDLSDVKAYEEVPFTVKVKSDRGLKNALKLVEALVEKKNIEKKTRFNRVDALEELKDVLSK